MNIRRVLALLSLIAILPSLAHAVAGGGGDGGCCGLPPELEERGRLIEQSFAETPRDSLARQRWAGTLCNNHPCADDVTEDQAKDLLDAFSARQDNWWQSLAIWSGLAIAGLSLALSLLAFRQTSKNERDIGRLENKTGEAGDKP